MTDFTREESWVKNLIDSSGQKVVNEKEGKSLEDFADWLRDNQEDMPPEYSKIVDDNFWELREDEI